MARPKLIARTQYASLWLMASVAAGLVAAGGCSGKGQRADACTTDADCEASLRCCPSFRQPPSVCSETFAFDADGGVCPSPAAG
jgi:hypothetical protein